MEIPMKLQKLVDHLDAEYKRRLEFLAQKLLNEHIIPVCERQKLPPEHIQVYAELNQTCSNYLFWPNGWDGDYELEFGNGKELS